MQNARANPPEALETTARAIWEERGDLRERFRSIASLEYWVWLMMEGHKSYPRILQDLPVPPVELRDRVNRANPTTARADGSSTDEDAA